MGLALPVSQNGCGSHQQRRSGLRVPCLVLQDGCEHLDRLAQSHVVCEAGPEADPFQVRQPGEAPHLVGPEAADECGGLAEDLQRVGVPQAVEHPSQAVLVYDLQAAGPCVRLRPQQLRDCHALRLAV